jgi:hypothetical protein
MVQNNPSAMQLPGCSRCVCGSVERHIEALHTWSFRHLAEQAARLYPSPEVQRLALLHHVAIMRAHAKTQARLLLWDAFARVLELDRAGARASGEAL